MPLSLFARGLAKLCVGCFIGTRTQPASGRSVWMSCGCLCLKNVLVLYHRCLAHQIRALRLLPGCAECVAAACPPCPRAPRHRPVTINGFVDVPEHNETALMQSVSHTVSWHGAHRVAQQGRATSCCAAHTQSRPLAEWKLHELARAKRKPPASNKLQSLLIIRPAATRPCSPRWWLCAAAIIWTSGTCTRAASWASLCSAPSRWTTRCWLWAMTLTRRAASSCESGMHSVAVGW